MKEIIDSIIAIKKALYEKIQEGNAGLQSSNALMKIEQAQKLLEDSQVIEFRKLETGRSFFIDQPLVTPETEVKVPERLKTLMEKTEQQKQTFQFRNTFEELQEAEVVEEPAEEEEKTPKKRTTRKKS